MWMRSAVLVAMAALGFAGSAWALEPISVPAGVERARGEATADGGVACPQLIRIKYPFLECVADTHGNVLLQSPEATTLSGRQMPRQGVFVESELLYWGRNKGN